MYTNHQAAGAYRGYGATQGIFALESAVNELADKLGMDPTILRDRNMVREGMDCLRLTTERQQMHVRLTAVWSTARRCLTGMKSILFATWQWQSACSRCWYGNAGSCISNLDVGSATLKLNEDGGYNLLI